MKRRRRPIGDRLRGAVRELLGPWPATEFPAQTGGSADLTRLILDWVTACMNPDDEVRGTLKKLRGRARDLERNNAYVTSYLDLLVTNVIGANGIPLQAKVRDNDGKLNTMINGKIEEAWKDWAENPVTADGQMNFADYLRLALPTAARDGEGFSRIHRGDQFPHGLALSGFDADLVDDSFNRAAGQGGNEVRMGIEVDELGRRIAFHVFDDYPGSFGGGARERNPIPAADVIHLVKYRRVNQTRGITWLGPCMIALRMLEGYEESELVAARVAASKMGFFQSMKPEGSSEFSPAKTGDPITMDANPGTLEQLPVGWEFKEWNPDHPTTQFPAFVKGNLRKISTGLGIPYNLLASDLEGVNFSSLRQGELNARDRWRSVQSWLTTIVCRRVFREWLASVLTRRILVLDQRDFRRFYAVKWSTRGWPWVDPLKDVQAAEAAIRNGLTSRTRVLAEQGIDFEDILEELKEENELAAEAKVTITAPAAAPAGAAADDTEDDTDTEDDDESGDGSENGNGRAEVIAAARERRR